ncbi:hypothetical protein FGO68_gene1929 [Halteria grandinella]|uniref:Uncharacterized protein n=1 Tax=Halteria grandinella TaxID=5974 RepID=A0A8J8SVB7_HALGN|nr:hypothetical protein FGO68_gene1929 [Halteria grandinella]
MSERSKISRVMIEIKQTVLSCVGCGALRKQLESEGRQIVSLQGRENKNWELLKDGFSNSFLGFLLSRRLSEKVETYLMAQILNLE